LSDLGTAFILGIVQGLTEFLPVSSSGHLVILQGMLSERFAGDVLFDVSLHLGTTLAIIVFFYQDLIRLFKGIMPRSFHRDDLQLILCILVTTLVTGIIGILFKERLEAMFSMPKLTAGMLLVTGLLTFLTDRVGSQAQSYGRIRYRDALIIGLFQAIAITPGISRSGATIFAGVLCSLERSWAGTYSFLAGIPAILGAAFLEWSHASQKLSCIHIVGAATACIVGLISLRFLVWTLRRKNFFIFSIYCWVLGGVYLIMGR
jgi:undecaprenyl-diphosphatase